MASTAAPSLEHVSIEVQSDGIAVLRFEHPERLNSMDVAMVTDARAALSWAALNPSVRALVVTGRGRGFCAGAYLGESGSSGVGESAGSVVYQNMRTSWNLFGMDLKHFPKPTIAVVNGPAAGAGFGIALLTDVTIAAKSTYFLLPFVPTLGISPDVGSTWHVGRQLPRGFGLPLALLGPRLPAPDAQARGLIWEAVEDSKLWDRGMELAKQLAALPRTSVLLVREAIDAAPKNSLADQLHLEADNQRQLFDDSESKAVMAKTAKQFRDAAARRTQKGKAAKL